MTKSVRLLIAAVGILALVGIGQAAYIATRPAPARVLNYPQQRVLSHVPGVDGPAVRIGDNLVTRGTKCNSSGALVPLTGETSWVSVDPPGSIVAAGRGSTTRVPGCVTREYVNAIPAAVATRTAQLVAAARPCVLWVATGRETPADPLQLPEVWTTEPFSVCP